MMPVVPTAKRSHGFTIDSLMSKDTPSSHLRDTRPAPPGPQMPPRSPRSPRSRSSPDVVPTRPPSSSGRAPTPSLRGPASSTPINLTASAEAATVPLRDGLFGGGGGGNNGGGHMGGGLPSSFHPVHSNAALLNSMKSLYAHEHAAAYPDGLAAAAALGFPVPLAATTAHGLPGGFTPAGHPGFTGAHPLLLGHHREHFNLYPWLMSRHGGYFGHGRFPGPDATHLLLQPFRKPKRIRTAFSPSQLLRLEHAFEKNHYVVGQERKDLAINLSLTETQVKVWFQNRRTKYKRMKAEESEGGSGGGREPRSPGSPRSDGRPEDHDDDDDSDMPLDVSSNPGEEELEMVDDEEDEEIIDCVTSPEDQEEQERGREAMMGDHHSRVGMMMSSSLMRDNVMSSSMLNSMSSSGMLSTSSSRSSGNNNLDPRLPPQQHSPSSPLPLTQPPHHHPMGEQLTVAHNDSLPPMHKGQVISSRPDRRPSPTRSPSPTSAKTAHHVERWRSETNQAQAV